MTTLYQLNLSFNFYPYLFLHSHYDERESKEVQKELRVLCGIMDHLLPRVGSHVQTLDLSHGKAVSNEVVSKNFISGQSRCQIQ